ncbi:hypothetical protein V7799_28765 [Rhizobium laguerreae]
MAPVILVCSQNAELYLLLAHILHGEGFKARLAASDADVADACTSAELSAVVLDCAGWPSDVAPLCALLKDSRLPVAALIGDDTRAQHLQLIKAGFDEGIARLLCRLQNSSPFSTAQARSLRLRLCATLLVPPRLSSARTPSWFQARE